MSTCLKCGKPVYFAERKRSLGKDWHPQCLRCQECGKVLNPGQHAEHHGLPYCHIPCYSALFGPETFGHGTSVESHRNFGKKEGRMGDQETQRLLAKLAEYNRHHEGKKRHLNSKMVNDRLVIEGLLQVYWGVKKPIQFKKGEAVMVRKKNHLADIINGFAEAGRSTEVDSRTLPAGGISSQETPASRPIQRERRGSLDDIDTGALAAAETVVKRGKKNKREIKKYNTIAYRGETATKKLKKRYTINGHFYNPKTSVFTPTHGTVTAVRVSSLLPVHDVIKLLLEKFKVENSPEEFALYIVKDNGETRKLEESDSPLITRVELGPDEDHIKLFIMEDSSQVITHEVAQYLNLPETVLLGIYKKFQEEEEKEVQRIRNWYVNYREALKRSMIDYQTYL